MGKWKIFTVFLLMLSLNLEETVAQTALDISMLHYSQPETVDTISKIHNLAKRDMLDALTSLLKVVKPDAGKVAEVVVNFIRAFTDTSTFISPETQMILNAIDRQTEILMDSLEKIARMIIDLSDYVATKVNKILFEQKYQGLRENIGKVNSAYDKFELILRSYTKKDELVRELKQFVQRMKDEDVDSKIVQSIRNDESHGGSESIIAAYIDFILINDVKLKCTPNQQIESFYSHALRHAHKINLLIATSYALLEQIEQADYSSDKRFFTNKIHFNTNVVKNSISRTFQNYRGIKYQYSVMHKIKKPMEDVNFLHLSRTFYNYIISEIDLTRHIQPEGNCRRTCTDYRYEPISRKDECEGFASNCRSIPDATVYEVMYSNRLYSGYSDGYKWYGSSNGPGTPRRIEGYTPFDPINDPNGPFGVYCDVCMCDCENYNGKHTKRWFYSNPINAPMGYVITGVRFAEKHRIMYLQPQVSKLVGIGLVDASTTRWMDVPIPAFSELQYNNFRGTIEISKGSSFETSSYVLGKNDYVTGYALETKKILDDDHSEPVIVRLKVVGKNVQEYGAHLHWGNEVRAESDYHHTKNILFEKSSEKHDASQHILPLLDNQDVILDQPLPLMGLSIKNYTTFDNVFNNYLVPQLIAIDVNRT